jgi:hypothetical protein
MLSLPSPRLMMSPVDFPFLERNGGSLLPLADFIALNPLPREGGPRSLE